MIFSTKKGFMRHNFGKECNIMQLLAIPSFLGLFLGGIITPPLKNKSLKTLPIEQKNTKLYKKIQKNTKLYTLET